MKFEGLDKNKLDVDFRNKTVLVNNIRVAQFYDEEGKSIKGRVKRDVHTFKIDKAKLTRNSKDISHPVDADKVQEEYDTAMRS